MSVRVDFFDKLDDGKSVDLITLDNGILGAKFLNLGANLYSLFVPDRNGERVDISLGLSNAQEYVDRFSAFGMTVGPVANRVAGGRFVLNGKEYKLKTNNHGNTLHSSDAAIQYKIWTYTTEEKDGCASVSFSTVCKDGEGGWPADRKIEVKYTLKKKSLLIDYKASVSSDAYLNLTNHSYFNLSGDASKDVLDYQMIINSGKYTEVSTPDLIPTGRILPVDSALDFRASKRIGENIPNGGYDHFFVVDGYPDFRKFASVFCPETGITMETWSDMPGMQLYTANTQASSGVVDKYGKTCCDFCAVCIETAFYTDSQNRNWPVNCLFTENNPFESRTEYRFI